MSKFTIVQRRSKSYNRERSSLLTSDKNYEEEYIEEKQKIAKELKIIDRFLIQLCRSFAR